MSLQVLNHQIFPANLGSPHLSVVPEVVHFLVRLQVDVVEELVNPVLFRPDYVPVCVAACTLPLSFPPSPSLHRLKDAVAEGRFESDRSPE